MDAALGKGTAGDQLAVIQLRQGGHALSQTVGEHKAFHLIILPDAVVAPCGVQHPVADVYQIQQAPELFLRHFQFHKSHLLWGKVFSTKIIARLSMGFQMKKQLSSANFCL